MRLTTRDGGDALHEVEDALGLPSYFGAAERFMPQLFFTDLSALFRSATVDGVTHQLSAAQIAAAGNIGLVDGMPFILGPDGTYDHQLNRFLRACPTMGVRSMNSLRAYARDIVVWMRFLKERREGKSLWAADRDDIAAFHEARRLFEPPYRVSAASWNRMIAALDKLYRRAIGEKILAATPITYNTAASASQTYVYGNLDQLTSDRSVNRMRKALSASSPTSVVRSRR